MKTFTKYANFANISVYYLKIELYQNIDINKYFPQYLDNKQ